MKKLAILFFALVSMCSLYAQNGRIVTDGWLKEHYTKREVMVQVRDGKRIYTSIYEPSKEYLRSLGKEKSPIMILRTPYSLKPYGLKPGETEKPAAACGYVGNMKGDMANYVADGYVIVLQNVRGKYLSEGDYENMRPYVSGPRGAVDTLKRADGSVVTDEATDIYDCIQWLLSNTPNSGKVGVKGVSYPGFYATMAALSRHPALEAVSPQAPATDWFMGDDAHHNGAFCLTDVYRFGSGFYRTRQSPATKGLSSLVKIDNDIYDYFNGKSFKELSAFLGDSLVFWNEMMAHPDYDKFWQDRDPSVHLRNIRVPMLVTGGFYDAEDCYGAFRTYDMLKKCSPECELYLAAGPWYHGGWNNRTVSHLSDAWFGEASGAWYQDKVEYPFFSHYLEGKELKPSYVNVLPSGETMKDKMQGQPSDGLWETYDIWPPENMKYIRYYMSGQCLSMTKGNRGKRTIVSNPASPVPYMNTNANSRDRAYMVADQRFASERKDVLVYHGDILKDTLHLAGPVKVHIELSLASDVEKELDADVIVKLVDVRPDGYQMLVRGDVMPLRFRNGFSEPKSAKSGKMVSVDFTMCDIDHKFIPGHSLMVQVQGSWFPLIAMNTQKFLRNPYESVSDDYIPVEISVMSTASWLDLPVCH